MHHDILIIGQGLAGSLLAWSLMQKGQSVLVISNNKPSASHIAAGLVNPVTGKRLVKSENVNHYLESGIKLYSTLESFFNNKYLHPAPMLRILKSADEKAVWQKRFRDPDYQGWLGELQQDTRIENLHTPFGSFEQQKTGWLDIPALLESLQTYFNQNHSMLCEQFDHRAVDFEPDKVIYKTHSARHVIFCEGYHAQNNPLFSWLPFKPAKGEILTCQSHSSINQKIINAGQWIVPVSDTLFKTGSTYQWDELNEHPDTSAAQKLQSGLEQIFVRTPAYDVIKHQAGVRPCTADTRVFLGTHPDNSHAGIFNGFGSRGSLTIPFYANLFIQNLLEKKPLPAYADIIRHLKKYKHHVADTTRT